MAKPRVHEIASEMGVTSKVALKTLETMGEFVKSASSSIEPPVARRLRNALKQQHAGAAASTPTPSARPKPGPGTARPARSSRGERRGTETGSRRGGASSRPTHSRSGVTPKPVPAPRHTVEGEPSGASQDAHAATEPRPDEQVRGRSGASGTAAPRPTTPRAASQAEHRGPEAAGSQERASHADAVHPHPHPGPHPVDESETRRRPQAPSSGGSRGREGTRSGSRPNAPRPGAHREGAPKPGPGGDRAIPRPRGPRPGNNPYASAQGMGRADRVAADLEVEHGSATR